MHMDLAEPMNHAAYWTLAVKRAAMRSNRRKGSGPGCVSWLDETPQPKQFRDELLQKLGDLYPLLTSDERKVMDAILDYPSVLVSRNEETDINASELARLLDTSPDTTPYKARQLYQSIKKKARKC